MSLHLIVYTVVSLLFIGVSIVALYFLRDIRLYLLDLVWHFSSKKEYGTKREDNQYREKVRKMLAGIKE